MATQYKYKGDSPLPPTPVSFMLTATADDIVAQGRKTKEEADEYIEAMWNLGKVELDNPKRITLHLKVVQERIDKIKSELNETRMYCEANDLDFSDCLALNDLNNKVRGYHG